ncbi:MAG: diaminopimelate epimerase [Sulfurimonas sp. RIFCSPHIGHO2_12_FULL_36_9]|uniref:diaminopimelate epimerase n=1 Tax=Sulfurimonas sp. RIFCSPLOWO2_12_36_12 TaxID=1802253 RepID=UPI0008AF4F5B|nr:diaminopimelate epimerase [Sulfurimonas sp. RIFCSPLOWO2_12_36_12]OHD97902.1 MAG: diaminopimelate epimerase [Sulfurimonas sp. RIFCSPHIGHO2_12_FULL_36_9]OHE01346.1 MAG: diaminopimelate epimerase [Sulfurimonas sp. RIFCSPLOWO2_12_36_12]OHE06985.1 MAG: diaminopimelate epimerase [Sulfurimonas sp. RIFCSPLOWO2_12_FULL_36_74]
MTISKYSANGNDFVIFHTFVKKERGVLSKKLCHRQDGVGADGLIVLVPHEKHDFEWQFYNSDGSEAEMCGNGSRACAHYAFANELAPKKMSFLTLAGVINAEVDGNMVQSELTPPKILDKEIEHNGKKWWKLDTGVPHLVYLTDNIEEFDIDEARELRYKYNANVNIAFVDGKNLRVRTYERGVEGETLACGTGMAASFYRALEENLVGKSIEVYPKSGETLYLGMNDRTITFKGEVKRVFITEFRG